MRTSSIWGRPPKRLYKLIKLAEHSFSDGFNACIVGCSDGKFMFPFARKGHQVTGYEIDKSAIYGATAEFPVFNKNKAVPYYGKYKMEIFPTKPKSYKGCIEKTKIEELEHLVVIEERNFYANPPKIQFDVVFTSCSFQYSINAGQTLEQKTKILQNIVSPNGFLYIDYMMAIDETDYNNFPETKYLRKGKIINFFDNSKWDILSLRENNKLSFENAHIEHPYHHYHRFGYILSQKRQK
jgi:hypothetical protein